MKLEVNFKAKHYHSLLKPNAKRLNFDYTTATGLYISLLSLLAMTLHACIFGLWSCLCGPATQIY